MLNKQAVLAMVNAMPESHFERVEDIDLIQAPSKFENGMAIASLVICAAPILLLGGALLADAIKGGAGWIDKKLEARKAKKAAATPAVQPQ